jgi:hypothetical protein
MAGELEALLNELKAKGIGGAVVRVDGVPVTSTMAINEISAGLIASVANISDALMKKSDDIQKEVEITFDDQTLVIVPLNNHLFCGLVKDKEDKKIVIEYADKAAPYLK